MILKTSRPFLYLLKTIRWNLILLLILALTVGYFDDLVGKANINFLIPLAVPAFFGTAIAFILAFRTGQAYERWWEARKIWGAIVNDSRTWTRMVLNLIGDGPEGNSPNVPLKKKLIDRQIAWNYILTARLREQDPLKDMAPYFTKENMAFIASVDNSNQAILFLQSRDLIQALDQERIEEYHHVELEEIIRSFEAYMGKLERIKNTHFPVLYDQFILFSIYLFTAVLTYAIIDDNLFFEAGFSVLVAGLFLNLEQFAKDLQDPFENLPTDTPMTAISYAIERGALQMAGETEMPPAPGQGPFFVN